MEALGIFLLLGFLVIFVLPIVAMVKANSAQGRVEQLDARITGLETELRRLRQLLKGESEPRKGPSETVPAKGFQAISPISPATAPERVPQERRVPSQEFVKPPVSETQSLPTPVAPTSQLNIEKPAKVEIPVSPSSGIEPPKGKSPQASHSLSLEQFMGAKLFAWIGGIALFFGVAFFIKYASDQHLIPPQVRAALGFLTGIGLLIGGIVMKRKETAVTAQTLCSTGVLVLYGVTFACKAFYKFPFFSTGPTFLLMSLITVVAFVLSVRLNAIAVAVLGLAGGFLTPVLIASEQNAPLHLFGYIALLDLGLLAVSLHRRWGTLPVLGAIGTVLMQISWMASFFEPTEVLTPMTILFGFQVLFVAAAALEKRTKRLNHSLSFGAVFTGAAALLAGFFFLGFESLGHRPVLLLSYVFAVDLGLLVLAFFDKALTKLETAAQLGVFVFLLSWTGSYLTPAHLYPALAFYFVFALIHTAAPLVMNRLRGSVISPWCGFVPALALVLVMMPIFKLAQLTLLIWPLVLAVDMIAVVLALLTAALLPILIVLVLTLITLGAWICNIPAELTGLPTSLFMMGGFAIFFIAAAAFISRKLESRSGNPTDPIGSGLLGSIEQASNLSVQIPALSATMPFLLLLMMTLRLPLLNPSPVFGLALLLVVLLLGMAKLMTLEALPLIGLACAVALEQTWQIAHFHPEHAVLPLAWHLLFYAVFTVFPFLFHRQFAKSTLPWAAAALAGPIHFYFLHRLVSSAYPVFHGAMGLLPAVFSIPALLGVVALLKRTPVDSPVRTTQLAWFCGVTLFFITLIFPIQFQRQWITIGWALEGVALCWLFHRVPHSGLRAVGFGLLLAAFARLALNPAVLSYHPRTATPILNWYLYAYGITVGCLFGAARLLDRPRNQIGDINAPPILWGLGTILTFLLVNIEIADFFSKPGSPVLTFAFSGNFARDMSYSIVWALFALALLIIGIARQSRPLRYGGIALLGVTLLKLFLHDLSQLEQLYRIAAFIVVAMIAMFASFIYQRFMDIPETTDETGAAL